MSKITITGAGDRLTEGRYVCQCKKIFTTDKDDKPITRGSDPAISILFECVSGDHEGQTHWERLPIRGKYTRRTIQLLKATGVIDMDDDVAAGIQFDSKDLQNKKVGIEIEKNGEYYNAVKFMAPETVGDDDGMPF